MGHNKVCFRQGLSSSASPRKKGYFVGNHILKKHKKIFKKNKEKKFESNFDESVHGKFHTSKCRFLEKKNSH